LSEKVFVILPTYNEKKNLAQLVTNILAVLNNQRITGQIIIVDDHSPDGTGQLADRLAKKLPDKITVIHRSGKLGLGSAYLTGFEKALRTGADYIFEMDADLSHSPTDIPKFLRAARQSDLVLGSRYVPGGQIKNWSVPRKLISRGGALYAKIILGLPINDLTSGFKCFRASALRQIELARVKSDGYSFQIELTYRVHQQKLKIKEIPIVFTDRQAGQSKFSAKIFWEAVVMVWQLRLNN